MNNVSHFFPPGLLDWPKWFCVAYPNWIEGIQCMRVSYGERKLFVSRWRAATKMLENIEMRQEKTEKNDKFVFDLTVFVYKSLWHWHCNFPSNDSRKKKCSVHWFGNDSTFKIQWQKLSRFHVTMNRSWHSPESLSRHRQRFYSMKRNRNDRNFCFGIRRQQCCWCRCALCPFRRCGKWCLIKRQLEKFNWVASIKTNS